MNNILVNTLIQNILFGEKWWLFRHLLFWVFIYLDEFLSLIGITSAYDEYYSIGFSFLLDVAVIYFNVYYLFPKFLKKRKLAEYIGFTALSIVILICVEYLIELYYWKESDIPFGFYVQVFVQTAVTLSAAVAVKVLKEALRENTLREEAEKQKLAFELKSLKKQVNPHFLFNILNGIYIQSQTNHKAVPETIMQFSDLLRYQIYDAEKHDKVLLTKEMEFIENYIALEQIRRENTDVNTSFVIENKSFRIEPLIFLTLVENAFKYSVPTSSTRSEINIEIIQEKEKLKFIINNTVAPISQNEYDDAGGFGLKNLRKRLNLLYQDMYELNIEETKDGIFSVKLEIATHEMHHN